MLSQIFRKKICACLCLLLLPALCASCGSAQAAPADESKKLVIYSTRPLSITDNVLARFEADTGIDVTCVTLRTSDALIRIEGESEHPQADILWPVTQETVLHKQALFSSIRTYSYAPSVLMCNVDLTYSPMVTGYNDLLLPQYKGRIAFADPGASSASYAHLVNMLYAMGNGNPEEGWTFVTQFCRQLKGNLLASDEEVFQGVLHGYFSVGLTLAESSEEYVHSGAHIRSVYMREGVIYHSDAVCMIKNAPHAENAEIFFQWILNDRTQVYLQKSQYQTSLHSIQDILQLSGDDTQTNVVTENMQTAAEKRTEWLQHFYTVMEEQTKKQQHEGS